MKYCKVLKQLGVRISPASTLRNYSLSKNKLPSEALSKSFYQIKGAPVPNYQPFIIKNACFSSTTKTNEKTVSKPSENFIIKGAKVVIHKAYAFTTWSGSLILISVGSVVAFVIFYNLYDEMTSKNSPIRYYEESVNLLKENSKILRYFGPGMTAHGDPRSTRRHSRKPSLYYHWDKDGRRHAVMMYFLEGDEYHELEGKVTLHMVDYSPIPQTSDSDSIWKYKGLTVETLGWPSRRITVKGDETRFGGTW